MRIFAKLTIIFITIILGGCTKNMPISEKPIIYNSVDTKLLEEVKPYSNKPEPTLKDKIEHQQYIECIDRIEKAHNPFGKTESPSIFKEILNHYSCS